MSERVDDRPIAELAERLRRSIRGEVRLDLATRALYASDASNYRVLPALLVTPETADDVPVALALSAEAGISVTPRGAGTSVAGNACGPGVLLDCSKLTRVSVVDPTTRTAVAEAGVILDALNRVCGRAGLRVGPDPSTHNRCTIGGMIANNACGSHSVRWGTTAESVLGLTVARVDGSLHHIDRSTIRTEQPSASETLAAKLASLVRTHESALRNELSPWSRRVSGYALDWLLPERGFDIARSLVGSEGTCAIVLDATLRLVAPPSARTLLVVGFADDIAAAGAVPAVLSGQPLTVEGMTSELLGPGDPNARRELLPRGDAWLLIETGGDSPDAAHAHAAAISALLGRAPHAPTVRILDEAPAQELWRIREDGAGRATRLADGSPAWPGFEDAVVPPTNLAAYLREFHALLRDHDVRGTTFGHFGEGCIHARLSFGLETPGGGRRLVEFTSQAADLVVRHGGSLSGEHGDGRARSALLARQFSPAVLAAFRAFKATWDPTGILNPGVIVDPAPIDQSLRAPLPASISLDTTVALRADRGDLRLAALRCVGIGSCTSTTRGGLMCPSYRATREERHSTRGRARLLQEMISGALVHEGWRSTAVHDALDLCLACKGCLSECPVGVDMATYKAEFLSHYYARRIRPRSHYSLGWLPMWLRLARPVAPLANTLLQPRPLRRVLAWLAGLEPDRPIPPLARRTLVAQAGSMGGLPAKPSRKVLLWPDTFTNYLSPEVGLAAIAVLRDAGFGVGMPRRPVCCGLTWVSTGQLGHARRVMRALVAEPELQSDEPIVVLEPSCAATLRSDLPEFVSGPAAERLARRVTTLAELLDGVGYVPPTVLKRTALVQPHCHQQAVLGTDADRRVLGRAGLEVAELVNGCCGLAGNFGAERGHGKITAAVAKLDLLPALDRATPETLVLADGFSCRTQIAAMSGRRARHLAQVLADQL